MVDDSAVVRRMVRALLAGSPDVVVSEACAGEACLSASETLAPDVVIMDWSMPSMNGIEATAELQHAARRARGGLHLH